ncbi:MAG: hypothetical protein QOE31_1299 [Solirubrobacteraceae bacterium]|nr:hypothetical protein [Solirubrobacteraceae bacterium]
MGSRSRKRRTASAAGAGAGAGATEGRAPVAPAAVEPAPAAPAAPQRSSPASDEVDPLRRRYARGRARDEAIRQELAPLQPGERPRIVTVAAFVAFAFAIANLIATLTVDGLSSDQGDPTVLAVVTTSILVLAGVGMLARRYWAVLGFQVILAMQIVVFSLALLRVQKWWLGILMAIAICLLGMLFWKLIRAMARLQMPDRGPLTAPRDP